MERLHSALDTGDQDTVIAITGVTLDVSGADSGPVTVTLELENAPDGDLALLIGPNTATVITEILPGVKATAKAGTLRTRGGEATATFTIEPGFRGLLRLDKEWNSKFKVCPKQ